MKKFRYTGALAGQTVAGVLLVGLSTPSAHAQDAGAPRSYLMLRMDRTEIPQDLLSQTIPTDQFYAIVGNKGQVDPTFSQEYQVDPSYNLGAGIMGSDNLKASALSAQGLDGYSAVIEEFVEGASMNEAAWETDPNIRAMIVLSERVPGDNQWPHGTTGAWPPVIVLPPIETPITCTKREYVAAAHPTNPLEEQRGVTGKWPPCDISPTGSGSLWAFTRELQERPKENDNIIMFRIGNE